MAELTGKNYNEILPVCETNTIGQWLIYNPHTMGANIQNKINQYSSLGLSQTILKNQKKRSEHKSTQVKGLECWAQFFMKFTSDPVTL